MDDFTELLKGVLEGCVLEIVGRGETYGYAITSHLHDLGLTGVAEGTVYTILLRLEKGSLVLVDRRPSPQGPPRKFYSLTEAGREELAGFWRRWDVISGTLDRLQEER